QRELVVVQDGADRVPLKECGGHGRAEVEVERFVRLLRAVAEHRNRKARGGEARRNGEGSRGALVVRVRLDLKAPPENVVPGQGVLCVAHDIELPGATRVRALKHRETRAMGALWRGRGEGIELAAGVVVRGSIRTRGNGAYGNSRSI